MGRIHGSRRGAEEATVRVAGLPGPPYIRSRPYRNVLREGAAPVATSPVLLAKLHLEPGPGPAAAIGGGLVLRDQPLVASPLDLRPRREAVRRQAARREEKVLVTDQTLDDFSPRPEGMIAQIAPLAWTQSKAM